jgi:hypothetical protein
MRSFGRLGGVCFGLCVLAACGGAVTTPDLSSSSGSSGEASSSGGGSSSTGSSTSSGGSSSGFGSSSSSGGSTSSSTSGSSTSSTGGTIDAGKKDATTFDSGFPLDGGGAFCVAPSTLPGFTPAWSPPAPHQNACTQQNIDDFRQFCLGAGNANACNSFLATAAGKACAACILTPATATAPGPLVDHSASQGYVSLNTAGCVALATGDTSATGCGAKLAASEQCDDVACINCQVTGDPATLAALEQCDSDAEAGACASYAAAAKCGDAIAEAGTAGNQCITGNDFDTGYNAIVPMFCLTP